MPCYLTSFQKTYRNYMTKGMYDFCFLHQTGNCRLLCRHILKICFALALTNWIIGPEMITVMIVHMPNFPPSKTPIITTRISNAFEQFCLASCSFLPRQTHIALFRHESDFYHKLVQTESFPMLQ